MKKFLYISGGILVVLMIAIFILSRFEKDVKLINKDDLQSKIQKEETFVIVFGLTTCPNCKNYQSGALKQYVNEKNSLPTYMLYIDENFESNQEEDLFLAQLGIPSFESVPTTFVIKNGRVVGSSVTGDIPLKELKEFITKRVA